MVKLIKDFLGEPFKPHFTLLAAAVAKTPLLRQAKKTPRDGEAFLIGY